MAKRQLPSPEELRQLLSYDPETGSIFWKPRGIEWFSNEHGRAGNAHSIWNSRYAEKPAFTSVDSTGYLRGAIFNVSVAAHRVAWALFHAEWPENYIDHINGDKLDNRLCNLRCVTQSENMKNSRMSTANTTGHRGVYRSPHGWTAQIKVGQKSRHLGSFRCFSDAVSARLKAEQCHGFHENHGRRS